VFTENERAYLDGQRLCRLATVNVRGEVHVVPCGFAYREEQGVIEITGFTLERSRKYRDVRATGRAAIVVDDMASVDPWWPRGIEVRGQAVAVGTGDEAVIRLYPARLVAWGLDTGPLQPPHARDVPAGEMTAPRS
jgi:PPOX class F420-dependent enzyme/OxyR family protein